MGDFPISTAVFCQKWALGAFPPRWTAKYEDFLHFHRGGSAENDHFEKKHRGSSTENGHFHLAHHGRGYNKDDWDGGKHNFQADVRAL